MRTHEQVVADVEQRFKELKEEKRKHDEEMAKPKHTRPCKTCRHFDVGWFSNPLMIPVDGSRKHGWVVENWPEKLQLCKGTSYRSEPEQALWEPRLTLFQKIVNIFKGESLS